MNFAFHPVAPASSRLHDGYQGIHGSLHLAVHQYIFILRVIADLIRRFPQPPLDHRLGILVPRFYDVIAGAIRIDGRDVRELRLASLRDKISIVAQDTFLFNDTVANNIGYGLEHASRPQIEQAARNAMAEEFILRMPEGYDTIIGERGVKLSGGQRQRLAIARALLKNAPILILDEATSHLDTESEMLVQGALQNLMEHRTVIVIAHRLSTVRRADRIVVLDRGRIAETGTHEELAGRGGIYQRLYDLQFMEADVNR